MCSLLLRLSRIVNKIIKNVLRVIFLLPPPLPMNMLMYQLSMHPKYAYDTVIVALIYKNVESGYNEHIP